MSSNTRLEERSDAIEGAICSFDYETGNNIDDKIAIKILELLIAKYHFGDVDLNFDNTVIEKGFNFVDEAIREDLSDIEKRDIVKLLAVIRFVADRRTRGDRESMDIIHTYVGARIAPGARILKI